MPLESRSAIGIPVHGNHVGEVGGADVDVPSPFVVVVLICYFLPPAGPAEIIWMIGR